MIHHVSVPARDPVHVAAVLAELLGGRDYPFAGPLPGARMAVSGDAHGTMIEVYPETITMAPGEDEAPAAYRQGPLPSGYLPFHALISVPLDRQAIEALGRRTGWRTRFFGRAAPGKPPVFHVIEFWIENRVLLEVVPADMIGAYENYIQIERLDALMAAR